MLVHTSHRTSDDRERVVAWALLLVQLGLLAAIFLLLRAMRGRGPAGSTREHVCSSWPASSCSASGC